MNMRAVVFMLFVSVVVLKSWAHVVDFDALTDVMLTEPLPANHPLRQANRAGSVKERLREIGQLVVDDLQWSFSDEFVKAA
jgi:hypothetical protein